MHSPYKIIHTVLLVTFLFFDGSVAAYASNRTTPEQISNGYSVLKLFLEDQQYLTIIRRTKMVITFSTISDNSTKLIDDIASTSKSALEEMEKLQSVKPKIIFVEFSDNMIGKATFNSLRMTEGKEFLFDSDFEKNLLLSQLKVLRVISHLALQLEEKETNAKRKKWLNKLATRYESYYQKVNARIFIASKQSQ